MHRKMSNDFSHRAFKFFIAGGLVFALACVLGVMEAVALAVAVGIGSGVLFILMARNIFHALWHSDESYKSTRKAISAYNEAICTALDDLNLARDFERAQNIAG